MEPEYLIMIAIIFTIPCCFVAYAIFLGITSGIAKFFSPKEKYEKLSTELEKQNSILKEELSLKCTQLQEHYADLEKNLKQDYANKFASQYAEELKNFRKDKELFKLILEDKKQSNPTMARVFSDYEWYIANRFALQLYHKKTPCKEICHHSQRIWSKKSRFKTAKQRIRISALLLGKPVAVACRI